MEDIGSGVHQNQYEVRDVKVDRGYTSLQVLEYSLSSAGDFEG